MTLETRSDLCVNLDTKTVEVASARVHLTGKEYQMLELLSVRKGATLTEEMFLNHLYGRRGRAKTKIINVFHLQAAQKAREARRAARSQVRTVWGRVERTKRPRFPPPEF